MGRRRCPAMTPCIGCARRYALDPTNAAYKRFALQQLGQRWEDEGCVEAADLGEVVDGQQVGAPGDAHSSGRPGR